MPLWYNKPIELKGHMVFLKQLDMISPLEQKLAEKDKVIAAKDVFIKCLQEEISLLRLQKFGCSADQYVDANQVALFDEKELDELNELNPVDEASTESIEVPAHTRKTNRGKRKPLPNCLERVRIEHKLDDSELIGPDGEQYVKIDESISEQLDIIPQEIKVLQHVRFKYAVKGQEELGVKTAPIKNQAFPKSVASSGLLAHIAQAKYCYHLPLYRQEAIWKELDVHIPRNSMCRWMMEVGERCQPIVEEILEQIKSQNHLHVDETTVTVLDEDNKRVKSDSKSHKGYMWVYTNSDGVVYDYQSTRAGQHASEKLEDFNGYVQTDAYAGYNQLFVAKLNDDQIEQPRKSVGCWAHARRKFTDILKISSKKKNTNAEKIVKLIAKLYQVEKHCFKNDYIHDDRKRYRLEKSKPILDKIKEALDDLVQKTPPQSLLGKAIAYSLNNWSQLIMYLEDGGIPIDNNPAERAIRPFTIGRKNWVFCGNTKGAQTSANLFSLIESAKLYNLKIFDYLKHIFEQLPEAKTAKDIEQLTPKYAHHKLPKLKAKETLKK